MTFRHGWSYRKVTWALQDKTGPLSCTPIKKTTTKWTYIEGFFDEVEALLTIARQGGHLSALSGPPQFQPARIELKDHDGNITHHKIWSRPRFEVLIRPDNDTDDKQRIAYEPWPGRTKGVLL